MVTQEQVLNVIREVNRPITADEITDKLGKDRTRPKYSVVAEVSNRCRQLRANGYVERTTMKGRQCNFWFIPADGDLQ